MELLMSTSVLRYYVGLSFFDCENFKQFCFYLYFPLDNFLKLQLKNDKIFILKAFKKTETLNT